MKNIEYVENSLPFVSMIIPCRNEEKFIKKCLDSVVGQTYPKDRFEILVFDGMSEDRTREILKNYSERVELLDNPKRIFASQLSSKRFCQRRCVYLPKWT